MSDLLNWYPGDRVVEFVLVVSIAVTIVSVAALIASLGFGRHPAIRHCMLLSALLIALASPLLTGAFIASGIAFVTLPLLSADDAKPTAEAGATTPAIVTVADKTDKRFRALVSAQENETPERAKERAVTGAVGNTDTTARAGLAHDDRIVGRHNRQSGDAAMRIGVFQRVATSVLFVWVVGCGVLLYRIARDWLKLIPLYRSLRPFSDESFKNVPFEAQQALSVQRLPQIAVSDGVRAPIAVGVFRPVIILPAGSLTAISRDQLRDVLVHEIAHVRGRDNLVLFLQAIAKAVFWPIFPVHLLKSALVRAREERSRQLRARQSRRCELRRDAATSGGIVSARQFRGLFIGNCELSRPA